MRLRVIFSAILAPVLMAATNNNGCSQPLPTNRQIELRIPKSVRSCPGFPKSPGGASSDRATAVYLVKLYDVARACKGNLGSVDKILDKYEGEVTALRQGSK